MALAVSALKQQIEKAKESLKNVDDSIKKVTGRDPNEMRFLPADRGRGRGRGGAVRLGRRSLDDRNTCMEEQMEPPAKRSGGVMRRVGSMSSGGGGDRRVIMSSLHPSHRQQQQPDSDNDDDEPVTRPTVQSSVVSTAKSHTKTELIKAQNVDEKGKARNRRMFGMLLGTLAKFQSDESKADLATKQEQRRSEIEKRLEESNAAERKKAAAERRELFNERKSQQRRIMLLEQKIVLAGELEEWEAEWEKKSKFIMTKATPPIFFMPKDTTGRTIRALQESKKRIKEKIEASRASMQKTMDNIDAEIEALDAMKRQATETAMPEKAVAEKAKPAEVEEAADDLTQEPNVDINVESDKGEDGEEMEQNDAENEEKMSDADDDDSQHTAEDMQNGADATEGVMEVENDVPLDKKDADDKGAESGPDSSPKQEDFVKTEASDTVKDEDMEEAVDQKQMIAQHAEGESTGVVRKEEIKDNSEGGNEDQEDIKSSDAKQDVNGDKSDHEASDEKTQSPNKVAEDDRDSGSESGSSESGSGTDSSAEEDEEEQEKAPAEAEKKDEDAEGKIPEAQAEVAPTNDTSAESKAKEANKTGQNSSKHTKSSECVSRSSRTQQRSKRESSSSSSSDSSPEQKPRSRRRSSRSSPQRESRSKPRGGSSRRRRSPSSSSSSRSRSPARSSKKSRRDSDRRRRRSRSRDRRSRRSPHRSSRRR